MDIKAKLLVDLLILSHLEGEDIALENILELLDSKHYGKHLEELRRDFGWMPPRVAFSKLSHNSGWRKSLAQAAQEYLQSHLLASSKTMKENWERMLPRRFLSQHFM